MAEVTLDTLYQQCVERFVDAVHKRFMASNRLADRWPEFETHLRARAAQQQGAYTAKFSEYERHSVLQGEINKQLTDMLEADELYRELMAPEAAKNTLHDIIARLDYDIWFVKFYRLRTKVDIYVMEAETDDFLTEEDRRTYERFRARQRAMRNPIYWRGAGAVLIEPTENPVALSYLRDSETVLQTRHAAALQATFERLKHDAHGLLLNDTSRLDFFKCMVDAVKPVLDHNPDAEERELVLPALKALQQLLEDWNRRRYHLETLNVVDPDKLLEVTRRGKREAVAS